MSSFSGLCLERLEDDLQKLGNGHIWARESERERERELALLTV